MVLLVICINMVFRVISNNGLTPHGTIKCSPHRINIILTLYKMRWSHLHLGGHLVNIWIHHQGSTQNQGKGCVVQHLALTHTDPWQWPWGNSHTWRWYGTSPWFTPILTFSDLIRYFFYALFCRQNQFVLITFSSRDNFT